MRIVNNTQSKKETYYANPVRSPQEELYNQIDIISVNTRLNELLKVEPSFLAILNENQQILTVNHNLLVFLGIGNSSELLGLRIGEAFKCIYSELMPAGCGTSKFCISCGAAAAIASALETDTHKEMYCTISSNKDSKDCDYLFKVKATSILIEKKKFIILLLNDIAQEQQRAYLEKTFFTDISNLINSLRNSIKNEDNLQFDKIKNLTDLLSQEIEIQKSLLTGNLDLFKPVNRTIKISTIFEYVDSFFRHSPWMDKVGLIISDENRNYNLNTDVALLLRVLLYMLNNAFEATIRKGSIKLSCEDNGSNISFNVKNNSYIPEEFALRIFTKYFTTKDELGRGLGTYFMKYIGENVLAGKVTFKTSKSAGTVFTISLPK